MLLLTAWFCLLCDTPASKNTSLHPASKGRKVLIYIFRNIFFKLKKKKRKKNSQENRLLSFLEVHQIFCCWLKHAARSLLCGTPYIFRIYITTMCRSPSKRDPDLVGQRRLESCQPSTFPASLDVSAHHLLPMNPTPASLTQPQPPSEPSWLPTTDFYLVFALHARSLKTLP